jgi:hypothetical protein
VRPKWENVRFDPTDECMGKILLSYSLMKAEDALSVEYEDIRPKW